ncbi:MAG TPA: CHAT domain-containing tetratricopeptide repeat protein [Thermoanaerobaculia bacterium]|nr:CHAT domain-containing tetratricopeptide repeat protein [Thermoanaerobaculia bacterium]
MCDRGHWNEAGPYIDAALQRFQGSDADAVWRLRMLRGRVLIARHDPPAAIAILAPSLPRRLALSDIEVHRLTYLAGANYRVMNDTVAQALLVRAERLARAHQPRTIADVLLYRATFEFHRKRYADATRYARASAAAARQYHQRTAEINAMTTGAIVLTEEEHYDEAIDLELKQLDLVSKTGAEATIVKVEGNLAWAYSSIGDLENASSLLSHATLLAKKIAADYDLITLLNLAGDVARLRGDREAALHYYAESLPIAQKFTHRDLADFTANMAAAQLEVGDIGAARLTNAEASKLARERGDQKQSLRTTLIDARIDAAAGDLASAVEKAEHVLSSKKTRPSQRWEAEARLAQFQVAANRSVDADEHFRRAIETADEARHDVKSDELRLSFGTLIREVYDDYVFFLLGAGRVREALTVAEMSRVQSLADALGSDSRPQQANFERVASDHHAVLLSYWLTPKRSYVWTITPSSIEVTELPPAATIEQKVESYSREILSLRGSMASLAHGAELYDMLVAPVAKRIPKGARVVVIPDGRLHAFNMETLVNPATRRYWIDSVTIETAGSLELLNRAKISSLPASMLLVGDAPAASAAFPRLLKAAEEMNLVQKHFGAACTTLKGTQATPSAYESARPDLRGYIHFVAHGMATRQRPLDSAVILARDGDSYKLYARDIIKQKLKARLVTISSCHGAGTRAYTGEGLVGLAWAFLHAGAHQVIAALWEVDDNATPELMDTLYAGIRAGQDPATALRNAKLKLIRGGSAFRQPRYWAPFVLYSGS